MSAVPFPHDLFTLEEWDALPECECHHVELAEGIPIVVPKPPSWHQLALKRLGAWLDQHLPPGLAALPAVDVLIDPVPPITVRAPDVVVVPSRLGPEYPKRFDADDVVLAVEIVSPGTRSRDRVVKSFEYADAGIPHYWLIQLDDQVGLTAFTLADGRYKALLTR